MSLMLLKNDLGYLMQEMECQNKIREKVFNIVKKLVIGDLFQKTRFEYSLQIKNGQLENGLRLVNYDTYYSISERNLYLKRINLIEDISLFHFGRRPILIKFFNIIRKFNQYRLPLYLGLESQQNKEILLKLYLNFFSLYRENGKLSQHLIQNILDKLNSKIKIRKVEIPLLGLAIDKKEEFVYFKLYYLYNKNSCLETFGFGKRELDIFRWLNYSNRLDYFDIMEKYKNNKIISTKIEVHPNPHRNFLRQLCKIIDAQTLVPKIKKIIKNTNGKIETVAIEKNKLTIYITLLNYGQQNQPKF
jgi:hypothetical protein